MNNYISKDEAYDAVSDLVDQALRAQREQVNTKVWQRLNQMERILDGGKTIFLQASGPRLAKIHELRQCLWCKVLLLYEVLENINES